MNEKAQSNPSAGRAVLFNGPPSSGKTSLVATLQQQLVTPWFHLSLDDFHSGFAEHSWLEDEGHLFDLLVVGYLQSLRQLALTGIDLLAEAVMVPGRRDVYDSTFGDMPILLIGVQCSLQEAIQREGARNDRRNGPLEFPANYFDAVYDGLTYDFVSETETGTPRELASEIVPILDGLTPSPFKNHLT